MAEVSFALIGEGSSDRALVSPLQRLLAKLGVSRANGYPIDFARLPVSVGASVVDKLDWAAKSDQVSDLFFIHRDSDSMSPESRRQEIQKAAAQVGCANFIPVVPVKAIEAWLLLSEVDLRRLSDNPRGTARLESLRPAAVERLADPKTKLYEQMRIASETSGRRRKRFNSTLAGRRTRLIESLDVNGPVTQMKAWAMLEDDVRRWLATRI